MATHEISVNRAFPDEALLALNAALTAALNTNGTICHGVVNRLGALSIVMDNSATGVQDNAALQLALTFDTATRTAAQLAETARAAALGDVLTRYGASSIANKTPGEIYTLIQGRIDAWASLPDAKADLRVWLPLIAAIAQSYIREKA